jgi:hypothetical protein
MRTTMRWLAAAGIGVVLLIGCSGTTNDGAKSVSGALNNSASQPSAGVAAPQAKDSLSATGAAGAASAGKAVDPAGPKIIRTGEIQLEVAKDGLKQSFDRIAAIATTKGGFVADSTLSASEGTNRTGRLVLRVPGEQVDAVIAEVGPLGKVLSTQLKGEDVTGQLVDLDARIKTLESEENALRTLVGKANTVGEVLQVQGSLFDVRQQIEQLKAQQSSLSGAVAYATLTVGIREPVPGAKPTTPADKPNALERSWRLAVDNTGAVLTAIVLTIGATVPLWVPALVLSGIAWLIYRRRRSTRGDLRPPSEELAAG